MSEETRWYEEYLEDPEIAASQHQLEKYKSPVDMMKSHFNLEAYRGNSIKLLGEEATPEEKAEWVGKVKERIPGVMIMPNEKNPEDLKRYMRDQGVPEDIDGYQPPSDLEPLPDEMMQQLREIAHKSDMSDKQFKKMVGEYAAANKQIQEQNATYQAEQEAQLKQTWGAAYEENEGIVAGIVEKFQDENVKLGVLNNAAKLFLVNIAKSLSSDPQVFNQINKPAQKQTPAELRVEVDEMRDMLRDRTIVGQRRKDLLKTFQKKSDQLAQYR